MGNKPSITGSHEADRYTGVRAESLQNSHAQFPIEPMVSIPEFSTLLTIWYGARKGRVTPHKASLRCELLKGWLGRIAISERDGDDYRLRLFGTEFSDVFGRDLTGCHLLASLGEHCGGLTHEHLATLLDGPFIGYTTGRVPIPGREFLELSIIDLPMSDQQGRNRFFLHGLSTPASG